MTWFGEVLAKYPELAVYLALAVGFWIGNLKIRGFSLGGTTGSLLAGIAIGLLEPSSYCSCSLASSSQRLVPS